MSRAFLVVIVLLGTAGAVVAYGDPARIERAKFAVSDLLRARVRAIYTIGSAAEKIESHLRGVVSIHSCETLDKAVSTAAAAAHPGEVVLLAPACSSFDQFESYEHRGRVFKELVNEWRGWKVWQNA